MDDDAPLSALAKAPKFDDNTPLASLADVGRPKTSARVGGSPATKGGPKAKARPKKANESDSSSSSSSSGSDSSSDSDSDKLKKGGPKKTIQKTQKLKLLRKLQTEESIAEDGGGAVKNKVRSAKEQLAADLLCRWWYVLPDWPPADEKYYQAALEKRSLRKVTIEEWEWVPELDEKGLRKVYELSQFRGMFRNSAGEMIDTRPRETCPCYSNFMKKDVTELYDLILVAYEKQLRDLKNSKYPEEKLEAELNVILTRTRDKAQQAKSLVGNRKSHA